jgi:hypothetical protein
MTILRTDIKRSVSSDLSFNTLAPDFEIALPASDFDDLKDALFSLSTRPAFQTAGAVQLLGGVEDLQVTLNASNITAPIVKAFQRALRAKPAKELEDQYHKGVLAWLDRIKVLGLQWPQFNQDRARALAMTAPALITAMSKLGDRTCGWAGQIHPINYLYREISLPPLSLGDTLASIAGDANALQIAVQKAGGLKIGLFQRDANTARGWTQVLLEGIYVNPLADLLEQALAQLEAARKTLEDQRVNYLLPTRDDLNQVKVDLPKGLSNISGSIMAIDASIKSLVVQK